MQSVNDSEELRRIVVGARRAGRTVGFVPTMGALHDGHASLVDRARADGHFVIVSVFVNPLQFNDANDLSAYPVTEAADTRLCDEHGVDIVYRPDVSTIYPEGFDTRVVPGEIARVFEGRSRAGHFDGVATVVLKLFNIVAPDVAYFGMKDYQQLAVIRRMVRDLNMPLHVVGCPTVRETDGLALSSRNVRLSPSARRKASALHRALQASVEHLGRGSDVATARSAGIAVLSGDADIALDYFDIVRRDTLEPLADGQRVPAVVLVAATVGGVRLIDNVEIDGEEA